MSDVVLFSLTIALIAATLVLAREVRLRRALQRYLTELLEQWRKM
jgi:hypothetical protein